MEEDLKVDWKQFIKWFNLTLIQYNSNIPPIKYITKGKKSQIQKIVNAIGTKQVLIDASIHMMKSDFLNGRVKGRNSQRGFIASFVWLMDNDERLADVANGAYDNPPEQAPTAEDLRRIKAEERERLAEQRREEAKRIEEEEAAARERQREYDRAHAAKGEELQRILAEIELPPLRENEKSPKQRIFS
jgi:hypothetical protein